MKHFPGVNRFNSFLVFALSLGVSSTLSAEEPLNPDELSIKASEMSKRVLGRDPMAISKMDELKKARERIENMRTLGQSASDSNLEEESEIRPYIVGGNDSEPGARSFQVALEIPEWGLNCGGSIIDDKWILTAAHCIGSNYVVKAGTVDLNEGGQILQVAHEVINPNFSWSTADSDIALLRLAEDAPEGLTRLKLADESVMALAGNPGDIATASGWGRLSNGGELPNILQEVDVPLISNEKCNEAYAPVYGEGAVTDTMICAGYDTGGRDTCNGDSGGPLTVNVDGEDYSIGVVSWGYDCALEGFYGVYAKTSVLKDWVLASMEAPVEEMGAIQLDEPLSGLGSIAAGQLLFNLDIEEDIDGYLEITTTGATGDVFLYVYEGETPILTNILCRSTITADDQICTLPYLPAGGYTIGLSAFRDFEDVTLSATVTPPPPTTELAFNVPAELDLTEGSEAFFSVDLPEDAIDMTISTLEGLGIGWMFVFEGSTAGPLVCSYFFIDAEDVCSMADLPAGEYSIVVFALTDLVGMKLNASYIPKTLQNGGVIEGIKGFAGQALVLNFDVPDYASNLTFTMSGGTGDADLYVRYAEVPTRRDFDCRPFLPGNEEVCSIDDAQAGSYFVMLHGYEDFSDISLVASYEEYLPPASCRYQLVDDDKRKFRAAINITNESAEPIDGWQVQWQYADGSRIIDSEYAKVTGDNPYTATNKRKNSVIPPGETLTFYVKGKKGAADPEIPEITGDICK